jgi:cytidylate kinase
VSPLKKAKDALMLDNTMISEEDQLKLALKWVKEKMKH